MNCSLGPDLPIGCGLHTDRLDSRYRTTYPLFAYLKPWGGEFVVVIQDGHILGMVRRDKRPAWQKLKERIRFFAERQFPKKDTNAVTDPDPAMADCCA